MIVKTNINAMSDDAIVANIGEFVKHHRLEQNKTQSQVAEQAGINRLTLIEFEKGKRISIITFIQLLRALNLLHMLEQFKINPQLSPIQLAEMEQAKRKRATRTKKTSKKTKSNW